MSQNQKKSTKKPIGKLKKETAKYHHGDLRNLVLQKSCEFLESFGVHNLSLRDIAAEIGVSHTAPYRHFPKKMDLLLAITALGFKELRDTLREAWEISEEPSEKLKKSGENYIRLAWRNPRRTELMFSGEVIPEGPISIDLAKYGEEAYYELFRVVQYGQEKGVFQKDINTDAMAMTVWSSVHGFAVLNERYIKSEDPAVRERVEMQMSLLLILVIDGIRNL